jgi:hypothetical protein
LYAILVVSDADAVSDRDAQSPNEKYGRAETLESESFGQRVREASQQRSKQLLNYRTKLVFPNLHCMGALKKELFFICASRIPSIWCLARAFAWKTSALSS